MTTAQMDPTTTTTQQTPSKSASNANSNSAEVFEYDPVYWAANGGRQLVR